MSTSECNNCGACSGCEARDLQERIAELETERETLLAELLKITSWNNELVDEHATQVQQLNDVIREAARMMTLLRQASGFAAQRAEVDDWLKHPTVVRAVTSPPAQAKVKE